MLVAWADRKATLLGEFSLFLRKTHPKVVGKRSLINATKHRQNKLILRIAWRKRLGNQNGVAVEGLKYEVGPFFVSAEASIDIFSAEKSHRWESNPQPPHYECGALPIKATAAWFFTD